MIMDNIQIGCFIADCRKEKQITQQQLADKLNITNKAVSKWETGNGLPDITLLTELADILDVSVDEILKAKKNEKGMCDSGDSNENTSAEKVMTPHTDTMISYLVHKSIAKFKLMAIVSIVLSVAGIIIPYFIWSETKDLTGWIFGCWLGICSAGVFYYYRTLMKNQIIDYNNTTEMKLNTKDISKPYIMFLRITWAIMPLMLIFHILIK